MKRLLTSDHCLFLVDERYVDLFWEQVENTSVSDSILVPSNMFSEQNFWAVFFNVWLVVSHPPNKLSMDPYKAIAYPLEYLFTQMIQQNEDFIEFQREMTKDQEMIFAYFLLQQIESWIKEMFSEESKQHIVSHQKKDYYTIWKTPEWEDDRAFLLQQKCLAQDLMRSFGHVRKYELMIFRAIRKTQLQYV